MRGLRSRRWRSCWARAVATSYAAKGVLPEDHGLSAGNLGWLGHPSAHELIREHADVVLVIGFSFSDLSTCWWTEGMPFVEQNRFIQIDIDANQIGRTYPVELGLLGDAKATLQDVLSALSAKEPAPGRQGNKELAAQVKGSFRLEVPGDGSDSAGMEPLRVVEELRRMLPREILFSLDTGDHNHYFGAFFPVYGPRRLLYPGGMDADGIWSNLDHRRQDGPPRLAGCVRDRRRRFPDGVPRGHYRG